MFADLPSPLFLYVSFFIYISHHATHTTRAERRFILFFADLAAHGERIDALLAHRIYIYTYIYLCIYVYMCVCVCVLTRRVNTGVRVKG